MSSEHLGPRSSTLNSLNLSFLLPMYRDQVSGVHCWTLVPVILNYQGYPRHIVGALFVIMYAASVGLSVYFLALISYALRNWLPLRLSCISLID